MKGTSNLVHIIILLVITFFVAAAVITIAGSAAEDADESTTGTVGALSKASVGERLYCKLYCPDPENNCDAKPSMVQICKDIADVPADFPGSGTMSGSSSDSAIVAGSFIPGGTLTVSFSPEVEAEYGLIDQSTGVKIYEGSTGTLIACTTGATAADQCEVTFDNDAKTVKIRIPYKRDTHNMEQKIREGTSYKISLEEADGSEVFSFNRAWSCPRPYIIDGKYYPGDVVFNIDTIYHPWVDMSKYADGSAEIEIGKRSGGSYPVCDNTNTNIYPTCTATVAPVGGNYKFTMPYTEAGEEVAISYPVYATGIDIKYPDGTGTKDGPMCRSGKEDYVYTCPTTACYTDGTGTYIVSPLDATGTFEANPACKYETKQKQCPIPLGCTMLLDNTAECSLPKPDLIAAFFVIKYSATNTLHEKELKEGAYIEKDDIFFIAIEGYSAKSVFVAIKNTAKEIDAATNEPKIRARNLEITALIDSVNVAVFPIPENHYDADGTLYTASTTLDSELKPGEIFEYDIPLTGIGDSLITHTLNIEVDAIGTFVSGLPAKFSADTQTSRSYSYTVYPLACKDCSFNIQASCEACGSRCEWNSVKPDNAACTIK